MAFHYTCTYKKVIIYRHNAIVTVAGINDVAVIKTIFIFLRKHNFVKV